MHAISYERPARRAFTTSGCTHRAGGRAPTLGRRAPRAQGTPRSRPKGFASRRRRCGGPPAPRAHGARPEPARRHTGEGGGGGAPARRAGRRGASGQGTDFPIASSTNVSHMLDYAGRHTLDHHGWQKHVLSPEPWTAKLRALWPTPLIDPQSRISPSWPPKDAQDTALASVRNDGR